jgi:endonuclease/exonuclease/phosphatase family metal-dependent hydrolase
MTYNIHNGFDVWGRLDLEALAQAIEAQQADVICLQEVSRGWLVNGSLDMVSWLARRLDMPYVFSASSGPLWGHVVFSRYPITLSETHPLPPVDLPLQRAFAYHQLDLGGDRTLNLINTHFHHGQDETNDPIRQLQAEAIIQFLSERALSDVILVGDLNTQPDTPALKRLLDFGLRDAIAFSKGAPAHTYRSDNPTIRLDYILASPTLKMNEMLITSSTASDHLGVVLTLE